MKKFLAIFLSIVIGAGIAYADRCRSCNGAGRVKTHVGTSGFGINNTKKRCSHCGQMYFVTSDHWDTCSACNGSGQTAGRSSSSSRSNSNSNSQAVEDWYLTYLTPQEYANWQQCLQTAMNPQTVAACPQCNGSGVCTACKGSGLSPIQSQVYDEFYYPNPCPVCYGTRNCSKCSGAKQVVVRDENMGRIANKQLEYYRDLVNQRRAAAGR